MKNKVLRIVLDVLMYTFIALCAVMVIFTIVAKRTDGAINVFGHQARIVVSESMEKCDQTDVSKYEIKDIPLKSMVFIELVPTDEAEAKAWYENLKVGDVLTFKYKYDRQEVITHRIVEKNANLDKNGNPTGWYTFVLRGDNKALSENGGASEADLGTQTIDTSVESVNYVIGKVTGQSKFLGFLLFALKSPIGLACIVIIPSLIIMTLEIIKVVGILTEDKKKKAKEEKEKQQSEIEELKKQLAELQKNANIETTEAVETTEPVETTKVEEPAEAVETTEAVETKEAVEDTKTANDN